MINYVHVAVSSNLIPSVPPLVPISWSKGAEREETQE